MGIDLPILADEERVSYKAAGAKLATLDELLGGSVVVKGVVASARDGVVQGRTVGEPAQLGGSMIIHPDGSIPWTHMSEDASDIAGPSEIVEALLTTASRGAAERGVDERLSDATRRDVEVALVVHQLERCAALFRELSGVISANRQAATRLGAVRRERRHDGRPARAEAALSQSNVVTTILVGDQEVEYGTVMPDVEVTDVFDGGHVAHDPLNEASAATQPTL
jgi:hypothetical protein